MSNRDSELTQAQSLAAVQYPDEMPALSVKAGDQFGHYILEAELGQGGMGTVWKARHFQLKDAVAVKFVTASVKRSPELLERFKSEILTVRGIRHPNIINILTCDWNSEPPFYVMDFVSDKDGNPQDLSSLIASGKMDIKDILKWTEQAAGALEAAHNSGVIHRDITPANILIDVYGNVKVCDFGLAKTQGGEVQHHTKTDKFIGTPSYASPEQRRKEKVDQRTDIFSLGSVLYEMLTGEHAGSASPSEIRDGLSAEWDNLYKKMTHPKLERRFQTMGEVIQRLKEISSGGTNNSHSAPVDNTERIPIFFAANTAYFRHTCVLMVSILENNPNLYFDFFIMTSRNVNSERGKILSLSEKYRNFTLRFIEMEDSMFANLPTPIEYISLQAYYRFLIPELALHILPKADKALYFDSDMICHCELYELWQTDLESAYLAGCHNTLGPYRHYMYEIKMPNATYLSHIGLPEKYHSQYINSGMLLLNLSKIRSDNKIPELISWVEKHRERSKFCDQDAINCVFAGQIKIIGCKWNFTGVDSIDNLRIGVTIDHTEDGYVFAASEPHCLVHFAGPAKPWRKDETGQHRFAYLYEQYLALSPYGNEPEDKEEEQRRCEAKEKAVGQTETCPKCQEPTPVEHNTLETGTKIATEKAERERRAKAETEGCAVGEQMVLTITPSVIPPINNGSVTGKRTVLTIGGVDLITAEIGNVTGEHTERLSIFQEAEKERRTVEAKAVAEKAERKRIEEEPRKAAVEDKEEDWEEDEEDDWEKDEEEDWEEDEEDDWEKDEEDDWEDDWEEDEEDDWEEDEEQKRRKAAEEAERIRLETPFTLWCEHCGVQLKAKEKAVGQTETCPKCQKSITIAHNMPVNHSTLNPGTRIIVPINNLQIPFRWCPSGTFQMGSPSSEPDRVANETQHKVTLTRGFWLGETAVTQEQWEAVMGSNPSNFKGAKLPVERVSWNDCQKFIGKLNGLGVAPTGFKFSLPTEAQWEYACRAGTITPFSFGGVLNGDKANCNGNYPYGTSTKGKYFGKTAAVGSYPANAWGLYDMHGNVWEWCNDWYGGYPTGSVTDPTGANSGSNRVFRGGGWNFIARDCRSAYRCCNPPSFRDSYLGLRLSLVSDSE